MMKTILIIINPIDNTKFIELPEEMNNYPINIEDLIIHMASMRVKAIDINLCRHERYVYVDFEFGRNTLKDLTEQSGNEYRAGHNSLNAWFDKSREKEFNNEHKK